MNLHLPESYTPRKTATEYADLVSDVTYQPHIYELAKFLAERHEAKYIIDIGCGSCKKLLPLAHQFQVIGIDAPVGLAIARKTLEKAQYIEHDLESGIPHIDKEIIKRAIVICSDVIEHLRNPDKLLKDLSSISKIAPYVLISTPDRDRARGWLDDGPPANPAHVMEWSANEFVRFIRSCGFSDIAFYGHTINTDFHRAKTTLLTITGTETKIPIPVSNFKVAAILHTYNEEDILREVIIHLNDQGVEPHVFDNWSNDGTWELLVKLFEDGLIKHLERFPPEPNNSYEWKRQLEKTTTHAQTLDADWIIHYDADEIRLSPWQKSRLKDAIARVDELGYNAIDFTVLDFRFLESQNEHSSSFQELLTHFEFGRRPGHFKQVKAWKNTTRVDLASSGGHDAMFGGRKIFPLKFLTKHYPLRNKEQALKKIHKDRLPRAHTEKSLHGWHTQYDKYLQDKEIKGWDCFDLKQWHPVFFMTENIVERLSGIGL